MSGSNARPVLLRCCAQQLDGDGMRLGATLEAELANDDGSIEWLKGTVTKLYKKGAAFDLHLTINNAKEKGEWTEKYSMKEEGKEWRFPQLSGKDFEAFGESAKAACKSETLPSSSKAHQADKEQKQGGASKKSRASTGAEADVVEEKQQKKGGSAKKSRSSSGGEAAAEADEDDSAMAPAPPGFFKVCGFLMDGSKAKKVVKKAGGIDAVTDNKQWGKIAGDLGIDLKAYPKASYSMKRAFSVFASKEGKTSKGVEVTAKRGRSKGKKSQGEGEEEMGMETEAEVKGVLPSVGDTIQGEMESGEKAGELEWVPGTVKRVNVKKSTFVVNFEIQTSFEKGDWDETYKLSEEGMEWRWPPADGAGSSKKKSKGRASAEGGVDEGGPAAAPAKGKSPKASKQKACEEEVMEVEEEELPLLDVRSRDYIMGWLSIDGEERWNLGLVTRVDRKKGAFTAMFGDEENEEEVFKARFLGADEGETWRRPDEETLAALEKERVDAEAAAAAAAAAEANGPVEKTDYGLAVGSMIEVLIMEENGQSKEWTVGEVSKIDKKKNTARVQFDTKEEGRWMIDISIDESEWRFSKKAAKAKQVGGMGQHML
jgi:hypothetical protein